MRPPQPPGPEAFCLDSAVHVATAAPTGCCNAERGADLAARAARLVADFDDTRLERVVFLLDAGFVDYRVACSHTYVPGAQLDV